MKRPASSTSLSVVWLFSFLAVGCSGRQDASRGETHSADEREEVGGEIFRETDFLVTDLFPSELTDGLEVLLIHQRETLERYWDLKADQLGLIESGSYEGEARREVAKRFGALLSHPESRIEELLAESASGS
jgi:hypothetical protein